VLLDDILLILRYYSSVNTIDKAFGSRLRSIRRLNDLSQLRLAELADVGRSTVANIETGRQGVTLELIYRFASALRIEPSGLLPSKDDLQSDVDGYRLGLLGLSPKSVRKINAITRADS
jgi:transcriptional regulator with XRE-family HTH domain